MFIYSARSNRRFSPDFHGRNARWGLVFALALTAATGCDRRGPEPHFIGQVLPLSGPNREHAQQAMRGVQLAIDEANADKDKRIGGRKVAALHADGAGDSKQTAAQAVRLVTINRVDAMISGVNRAEANQVAQVAREYGIPTVNAAGVTTAAPKVVFALGLSELDRAKVIDRFIHEKLKPQQMAIVTEGADADANQFTDELAQLGRSHNIAVTQIQVGDPGVIGDRLSRFDGPITVNASAKSFLQLRRLLIAGKSPSLLIYAGDESGRDEVVASADDAYFVSAFYAVDSPEYAAFVKRFREKFALEPSLESAANYDATRFLLHTAHDVQTFGVVRIVERLKETKSFTGLMGPLSIDADRILRGPTFVIQAKQGKETLVDRFDPPPVTDDKKKDEPKAPAEKKN